jgi:hypothetical protein
MSNLVIAILTSISAVVLVWAVKANLRNAPSVSIAIQTVMFNCVVAMVLAVFLELVGNMVVVSWITGIKLVLNATLNLLFDSSFLLACFWDFVRFTPLGAFVALADASTQIRSKKIIRCSIAAGITAAIILIMSGVQQTFVLLACAIGGPIIGIVIASISSFPKRVGMTRFVTRLFSCLLMYPKTTAIALVVVVLVVSQFWHRTSRVFLTLSSWREVSANYNEITATKNSPRVSAAFRLADSLPVGAADATKWLYFKSGKNKLDFSVTIARDPNIASSGQQVELIVSRVDEDLLSGDEFLDQLVFKKPDFKTELVYRGKLSLDPLYKQGCPICSSWLPDLPGSSFSSFSIEAPQFVCTVYDAIKKATGSVEIVITTPFRKTFEVNKINSIPLVPGTKNATPSSDWINVHASEEILGFNASADKGIAMFCRASRNSSNIPPFDIRVSGHGLVNPIVIKGGGGNSKSQARAFGSLPGFIVEVRSREGRVGIGNARVGSNSIALGSADFRFVPGKVSRIVARYSHGGMKIDADNGIPIDITDEVDLAAGELELSYLTGDEIAVKGESKNIVINGRSLSKSLVPDWVKELISKIVGFK